MRLPHHEDHGRVLVKGYYRNYDGMHLLKHALHNTCPDMMKSIGKDENGNDIKEIGRAHV